ncbi:MAG TPA: G8 domain-containing protein [Candidatus Angelobacter sp.]
MAFPPTLGAGLCTFASAMRPRIVKYIATVNGLLLCAALIAALASLSAMAEAQQVPAITCTTGRLPNGNGEDLVIMTGTCTAGHGIYKFHNVNIHGGGELHFVDNGDTDFWAESILIEKGGSLTAGTADVPYGANGTLVIHLWGAEQKAGSGTGDGGVGITCLSEPRIQCGVPDKLWTSNRMSLNPASCVRAKDVDGFNNNLPGKVDDCFYAYLPLTYDDGGTPPSYFGYKVLAVSYGGTLRLFGQKGTVKDPQMPNSSGRSWARLGTNLAGGKNEKTFVLDRVVDWKKKDQIVITSTDYLPGHAEVLTLAQDAVSDSQKSTITTQEAIANPHYGKQFDLPKARGTTGPDQPTVDIRAAVGLLTRSIRIVSGGNRLLDPFPDEPTDGKPGYYFGGHTVFRQGFESVQIRGVEFFQLGEGGRIMHYPIHFHMTRKTPQSPQPPGPATFIEDSSIWDSMTRWIALHASQGVTLARNVGYKSIGHGYYLEDATETDNRLYSNLGVFARAAVINPQNKRQVPGILAAPYPDPANLPKNRAQEEVPYHTDIDHPAVFWITNGWNDFQYNFASGAGTCGACYWLVPAANSTMSRHEYWWSYASEQKWGADEKNPLARASMSPLQRFEGNQCSTAMNSFNTVGNTSPCFGVVRDANQELPRMLPVTEGALAPDPASERSDGYYPRVDQGGGRFATQCPAGETDCSAIPRCDSANIAGCMVTVLNHYTTSFNWTENNFSAVWLRPQWYLFSNSNVTDVQNGGLTFVTGGGYTRSDAILGHWAIARNDSFIGHTQPTAEKGGNPYADAAGPFNPATRAKGLKCATQKSGATAGNYCLDVDQGISLPITNFGNNQRLFNIYDGPAYQENNAYLNITRTDIKDCNPKTAGGNCTNSKWMYGQVFGMPKDAQGKCYLPNAAIGWKQPNGFYYPPAFHSNNLFFDNVDIRHFVIEPLFKPGTYQTDDERVKKRYCTYLPNVQFADFSDIDRQTELNDDDGSLTGLIDTISVNKDAFFNAPVEDLECASDVAGNMPPVCNKDDETCGTAKTSPYGFVTTVVYPDCGMDCPKLCDDCEDSGHWWARACTSSKCYGVPLYRDYLNPNEQGVQPPIRMAGQGIAQRSSLTLNHGKYYIDTTMSEKTQRNARQFINVFKGGHTYYTFLLFAKPKPDDPKGAPATKQTYQMYIGVPGFNKDTDVFPVRANVEKIPLEFPPSQMKIEKEYKDGLLTVTLDMGFDEFKTNYNKVAKEKCQPRTFCSWNDGNSSCGCALGGSDPLYQQCQAVCSAWTNKDVDCPDGGCYGFGVKFPDGFEAKEQYKPPVPSCYPDDSNWNVKFHRRDDAGSCTYKTLPPEGKFCKSGGPN